MRAQDPSEALGRQTVRRASAEQRGAVHAETLPCRLCGVGLEPLAALLAILRECGRRTRRHADAHSSHPWLGRELRWCGLPTAGAAPGLRRVAVPRGLRRVGLEVPHLLQDVRQRHRAMQAARGISGQVRRPYLCPRAAEALPGASLPARLHRFGVECVVGLLEDMRPRRSAEAFALRDAAAPCRWQSVPTCHRQPLLRVAGAVPR